MWCLIDKNWALAIIPSMINIVIVNFESFGCDPVTYNEMICYSTEKPMSRQSSLDSTSGRRPAVTKQNSADDWLGLGDEQPISSPAQVTNRKATKPKPSPGRLSQTLHYITLQESH